MLLAALASLLVGLFVFIYLVRLPTVWQSTATIQAPLLTDSTDNTREAFVGKDRTRILLARVQGIASSSMTLEPAAESLGLEAEELRRNLSFRIDDGDGELRLSMRADSAALSTKSLEVVLSHIRSAYTEAVTKAANASVEPLRVEETRLVEELKKVRSGEGKIKSQPGISASEEDILGQIKDVRSEISRQMAAGLSEADGWFVSESPLAEKRPKKNPIVELPLASALLFFLALLSLRILSVRSLS